jgi:hypothetical protein
VKDKKRILIATGIAAALAFSLWHPLLRQIVLFILPLGSGVDDLVFFAALIFVGIGFVLYYTNGKFWIFERKECDEKPELETFDFKKGK